MIKHLRSSSNDDIAVHGQQMGRQKSSGSNKRNQDPAQVKSNRKVEISSFERTLRQTLPANSDRKVSEEELFSALVFERLGALVDNATAVKYRKQFNLISDQMITADSSRGVHYEKAALKALKEVVKNEAIEQDVANAVYSQAFEAADLNSIRDALYDGRGGKGDPTIAVKNIESALKKAQRYISKIETGSISYTERSLNSAKPTGYPVPPIGDIGNPFSLKV